LSAPKENGVTDKVKPTATKNSSSAAAAAAAAAGAAAAFAAANPSVVS